MTLLITQALEFAAIKHDNQKWGSKHYTVHLGLVAETVRRLATEVGCTTESINSLVAAAYLHDTLEDTDTGRMELIEQFGEEVAELVWCVTDEGDEDECRESRKAMTYPKTKTSNLAVLLKLADRIVNVRNSLNESKYLIMYVAEQPKFEQGLRTPGLFDQAWEELNLLLKGHSMIGNPNFTTSSMRWPVIVGDPIWHNGEKCLIIAAQYPESVTVVGDNGMHYKITNIKPIRGGQK